MKDVRKEEILMSECEFYSNRINFYTELLEVAKELKLDLLVKEYQDKINSYKEKKKQNIINIISLDIEGSAYK